MSFIKDYFRLNRKEYLGFRLMLGLIVVAILARYVTLYFFAPAKTDFSKLNKLAEALKAGNPDSSIEMSQDNYAKMETPKERSSLFYFDPNTTDENHLLALGMPGKVVAHIIHYREKGGRFRKPEDLQKIYGLSAFDYRRLVPWIRIQESQNTGMTLNPKPETFNSSPVRLDLNAADSIQLLSIKGIGPVYASRILVYRGKLGGFYKVEQLKEVYGIDSLHFVAIEPQVQVVKPPNKINLNACDAGALGKHPYIRYKLANAIMAYRQQHGPFQSLEDLKKIYVMNDAVFQKIQPYLEIENQKAER